jgi:hypothetical protein
LWIRALLRLLDHGRTQEEGGYVLAQSQRRVSVFVVPAAGCGTAFVAATVGRGLALLRATMVLRRT